MGSQIVIVILSILSYSQSHHRCRLQKLLAIYLKFKGISAKGFDTLHAMALTMSHKWTCNSVKRISERGMDEVRQRARKDSWSLAYDNLQLPMTVYSQRIDSKSQFGNGTAATVFVKRDAKPLSSSANQDLKTQRARGMKDPLTGTDIMNLARRSTPRLIKQAEYYVLQFLLNSPEFDQKTYSGRRSDLLQQLAPVDRLPYGPDHITLQYLLGTVDRPEASYADHEFLLNEWLQQLGWDNDEGRKRLAAERVVTWVGDQLTIDRIRGVYTARAEDSNSYERLDFSIFTFGWLHCQMAFANSLHKQYLGNNHGRGLKHAFTLLDRKGLTKVLTKGPFHHDLEEALYHVAEAHFREDWLQIGRVMKLEDLRKKNPEELRALAKRIVAERASTEALNRQDHLPENSRDEELRQVIMWNRDILDYIILDHAIEEGDVGIMEMMLPHLYIRFHGGGNGNYAEEVLELMQGLEKEWPNEIW